MIDIEAIVNRHLTSDKMDNKTFYEGHIVIDLYNAIEEIKRLRQINDDYLLEMGRQHALLRDQKRGENAERAAVMTFINERAEKIRFTLAERSIPLLKDILYCIERGEHLKES